MFDLPPMEALPIDDQIVITASRTPVALPETSDAISVFDAPLIDRLGEDRLTDLLRLAPSTALAETGPPGTQAQLRIRGAEANHSLLFIDGIKANDPAAGNEARFELLGAEAGDMIELMRGSQSALWGPEAIGGVVALRSAAPADGLDASLLGEIGSDQFRRLSSRLAFGGENGQLVAALGTQSSDGFDSFGEDGERDGYALTTGRFAGELTLGALTLEASGFAVDGRSEFDGYDPVTFQRADTEDETDNRLLAGRLGATFADLGVDRLGFAASYLDSRNENFLANAETNWTAADRLALSFDAVETIGNFTIIAAIDHEREGFTADDVAFGGFTRQDVSRHRTGFVAEARYASHRWHGDVALRHDDFADHPGATSLSAGLGVTLGRGFNLAINYGEGIAQPTFYDLYGFFPGSFVGNPDVVPERARGGDVGLRYTNDRLSASLTWFRQTLTDEIVTTFDSTTFLSSVENGQGKSHREGIEVEASARFSDAFTLGANYSHLVADEPGVTGVLDETRRPRHRGALFVSGDGGRLSYGASLALVGAREDMDFDPWPAQRVRLPSHALLSARVGWKLSDQLELSLRGTNLTDADYQDVVGYNTQGRAVFAGIRLSR